MAPKKSSRKWPVLGTAFVLIGLLGCGCAYLNTFYNARTAYNTARREHIKLQRTNADTASTLPAQISDLYDRAISKSLKVLEVYPKNKKWHDDAVYVMGRASYYKGEMNSAIRRLRRLQREFPESPYIPESYLYVGKAYLENENLVKAEETFQFILEKYPRLNANEEVTLLLATVAIRRQGKAQAVELLEKTLETVKTPDRKMEILLQMADLYIDLRQYEKAISVLKRAPRKKNLPELLYRIDSALLTCYGQTGQYQKALDLSALMLKSRQYINHYPEIQLKKGRILKKAGKTDDAVDVFEQITKGTTAPDIQGAAWYELALIYQHVRGDFKKAKECYEKAASLATDEQIKRTAQTRSQAIDKLASYRGFLEDEWAQRDSTDTTDTAAAAPAIDTTAPLDITRYRMGEIYWLQLEEPDSALVHFDAITSDTASSDTIQTQALFARAWITLHMKADSAASDSLFKLIIDTHPATLYAKRSQVELGIPVTIRTREDSAHAALFAAEKLFYEDGDALAASRAYLDVARQYPDLDIGPQCMYAAAWLCDNVLNKNVTARKLYRTLCDSFPQSQLCLSEAKPRLQMVEDTLRALKERKKETDKEQKKGGTRRGSRAKKAQGEEAAKDTGESQEEDDGLLDDGAAQGDSLDEAAEGGSNALDTAHAPQVPAGPRNAPQGAAMQPDGAAITRRPPQGAQDAPGDGGGPAHASPE